MNYYELSNVSFKLLDSNNNLTRDCVPIPC